MDWTLPNAGMGDLERAEEAAVGLVRWLSVLFASSFTEGTRLDVAVANAVLGLAAVTAAFFKRPAGTFLSVAAPLFGVGLGIAFDVAVAVLLRPHTLWTRDLADDKKPNREGLGF